MTGQVRQRVNFRATNYQGPRRRPAPTQVLVCWRPENPTQVQLMFPAGPRWVVPREFLVDGLTDRAPDVDALDGGDVALDEDVSNVQIFPSTTHMQCVDIAFTGTDTRTKLWVTVVFRVHRHPLARFLAATFAAESDAWLTEVLT